MKNKTTYRCPKCGNTTTPPIKPIEVVCENYEGHHSNRSFPMIPVVDTDDSNKEE